MSGYPGSGYPQGGGYPGGGYPGGQPQGGGYPNAPPSGGHPNAPPSSGYPGPPSSGYQQQGQGGYPGPRPGGYPAGPPQQPGQGGYPGPRPGGYPAGPPQQQHYAGAQFPPPAYNQGGYGAPQMDPQVSQWFNAVDTDRSGSITAQELQKALVNGNWSNFSEEACRMMIEMFDRDRKGTINIHEFGSLFQYINQWKGTFESFDRDRSGFIESPELTQALQQMGYRFSDTFIQNLLTKYGPRTRKLTLDNFIVACVQIKRLTDSFRTRDRQMNGTATLAYEDFVGLALGVHQ